ncbi:hypothetical protein L228DRAFT_248997 [Xylona heveae TC161]|uniref:Vps72/YL1 C-terminal domain-containing protein n=1 Tax=Xylona heveae (strain CBS 132557 / TC161) TaxID=1328760 RepID=A0A165FP39_XYLHT|nr:hypothetical protein L228DRAFT_248997 [Xylona heveae TC161]KZF21214.1 hypothetical protein L228DRAFT_248997 [Xylona heveae TC161]
MAPATPAADDSHQQLLDSLDLIPVPKPFRNPNWNPPVRRNKNVKQIVADASRKEASVMATQNNSGVSTPQPGAGGGPDNVSVARATQNLSGLAVSDGPVATYTNIESAPSLHPASQKRYCDLTGLLAPYTDPKTRLRYHNKEIFGVVRTLGQGAAEQYLEARGAHVVLK